MEKIKHIIIFCITLLLVACNNTHVTPTGAYHLTCKLDDKFHKDSATLYIVEPDYKGLTCEGLSTTTDNNFKWNGHIDGAHVAFIKFKNDSIRFYFVLEPGDIDININSKGWLISGGAYNNAYIHTLNHRQNILDAKKELWKKYSAQSKDSTLTQEQEVNYIMQDSLLTDSLERYLVWRIKVGDPASVILKERLFNTLTTKSQKKI